MLAVELDKNQYSWKLHRKTLIMLKNWNNVSKKWSELRIDLSFSMKKIFVFPYLWPVSVCTKIDILLRNQEHSSDL